MRHKLTAIFFIIVMVATLGAIPSSHFRNTKSPKKSFFSRSLQKNYKNCENLPLLKRFDNFGIGSLSTLLVILIDVLERTNRKGTLSYFTKGAQRRHESPLGQVTLPSHFCSPHSPSSLLERWLFNIAPINNLNN